MTSLQPGPGATLLIRDCVGTQVTRRCADWRGTFDVLVDRDVPHAVLTIRFYQGELLCGYGAATQDVVPGGRATTFQSSVVFVSDEFGTFLKGTCAFPATTDRMTASLWTDVDWDAQLSAEFTRSYTFADR